MKKANRVKKDSNKHAVLVRADQLQEGMVLAEDVKHFNGRLLLEKESNLTAQELRILKMWGITEAKVVLRQTGVGEKVSSLDSALFAELKETVDDHFSFVDLSLPFNRELHRLALQHNSTPEAAQRLIAARELQKKSHKISSALSLPFTDLKGILKNTSLPSLPSIVIRINNAIRDPHCTATHIADIISKDSSLSARILKLVNSPFYGFPTTISSIARAVTIIGFRQLSLLAVGTAVTSTFENIPPNILDMASFWKHSIACGIIARILSSYKRNANTENYFLSGLLHDIGRLIIFRDFPEHAADIVTYRTHQADMMIGLEKEYLGIDHAELGGLLVKKWNLAPAFEYSCRFHHDPLDSPDIMLTSVVHTANIIATGLYFGNSGETYVPPIDVKAWETIGLPVSVLAPTVAQTAQILKQTVEDYLQMPKNEKKEKIFHE